MKLVPYKRGWRAPWPPRHSKKAASVNQEAGYHQIHNLSAPLFRISNVQNGQKYMSVVYKPARTDWLPLEEGILEEIPTQLLLVLTSN